MKLTLVIWSYQYSFKTDAYMYSTLYIFSSIENNLGLEGAMYMILDHFVCFELCA